MEFLIRSIFFKLERLNRQEEFKAFSIYLLVMIVLYEREALWIEQSHLVVSIQLRTPKQPTTVILPPRQQCWVSDIRDAQHRTFIHEVSLAIAIAAFEQSYKNILIDINDKDRQGLRDRQLPFKIFAMMQHNC